MVNDEDRRQVDRLQNLVRGFDWIVVKVDYADDKVQVVMERPTTGEPVDTSAGPG